MTGDLLRCRRQLTIGGVALTDEVYDELRGNAKVFLEGLDHFSIRGPGGDLKRLARQILMTDMPKPIGEKKLPVPGGGLRKGGGVRGESRQVRGGVDTLSRGHQFMYP